MRRGRLPETQGGRKLQANPKSEARTAMAHEGMVIVTGGSRGIGAAVCRKLAALGHAVAVNYTERAEKAEAVADGIRKAGGRADAVKADVAEEGEIVAMFEKAAREL